MYGYLPVGLGLGFFCDSVTAIHEVWWRQVERIRFVRYTCCMAWNGGKAIQTAAVDSVLVCDVRARPNDGLFTVSTSRSLSLGLERREAAVVRLCFRVGCLFPFLSFACVS